MKRSPLKRPTIEQVRAWDTKRRQRTPIARIGRKARRERRDLDAFRIAVRDQAGGYCEGQVYGICGAHVHVGTTAHHLWPEDRDCGRHDPARGAWLCWTAHRWVHSEPDAARDLGLLRPDAHA